MPLVIYLCTFNFQCKSNNISIFYYEIIFEHNSITNFNNTFDQLLVH
jgi:hypothetical protein